MSERMRLVRDPMPFDLPSLATNVVSLWSDYTPVPDCHELVPVFSDTEDGEVTKSYKEWRTEFIYFDRDKEESAHSDLAAHRHSHIKLIASKPGA